MEADTRSWPAENGSARPRCTCAPSWRVASDSTTVAAKSSLASLLPRFQSLDHELAELDQAIEALLLATAPDRLAHFGTRAADGLRTGHASREGPLDGGRGRFEVLCDTAPIALGQIGGHHLDGLHPGRVLRRAPSAQLRGPVALDQVDGSSRRDRPCQWRRWCGGPASPRGTRFRRCRGPARSRPEKGPRRGACRGAPRRQSPSTSTPRALWPPRPRAERARPPGGWLRRRRAR